MKCLGILIVVVGVALAAMPVQADAIPAYTQLVVNGGGEAPGYDGPTPDYWTKIGGAVEGYTGNAYEGNIRITVYNYGAAYQMHVYGDGFASDVTSLELTGWMRSEGGSPSEGYGTITLEAGYWDGSSFSAGYEIASFANDGSTTWKSQTVSVPVYHGTVETNAFSVTIRNTNGNAVYFDAISVTTVPEPGTIAILAAGLVGLLAYAWRKRR